MEAYCCHPLIAQGRVIGTLSFGTKTRTRFGDEDVALMKTVADEVALAMQRIQTQGSYWPPTSSSSRAIAAKNDFLAVLSHELRNPLAPITNSLYLLERAAPGGHQAQRARQVIERQVGQLTHLVNDLLDLTRVSRNKIQLQRQRVDLCDLVRRCAEDQRSLFERGELHFEPAVAADPIWVNADGTRVAQVVGNLLQNAAKFTGRGGTVTVSVTADRTAGHAVVAVRDTGVGMTSETLAGLFQPFMQADQTLDRSKGGLGLGLALVKGLVALHGGEVSAHSEGLGRGCRGHLHASPRGRSRRQRPPPRARAPSQTATRPGHRGQHRRGRQPPRSARARRPLGCRRLQWSGRLSTALEFRPEVVLCDIGLPGMDGFDVARAFRRDDRLKGVFLVALSGYAQPEDLVRAEGAGFQRHLAKPPSLDKLEEILGNLRP